MGSLSSIVFLLCPLALMGMCIFFLLVLFNHNYCASILTSWRVCLPPDKHSRYLATIIRLLFRSGHCYALITAKLNFRLGIYP